VKITPEETPYTVTFESVNPTIATVARSDSNDNSAIVKALYPGETMINIIVTAKNSKGEVSISNGYLLTVVERKKSSGGGGGCWATEFGGLASMALAGVFLLKRRTR
jgi:hypothetical protein